MVLTPETRVSLDEGNRCAETASHPVNSPAPSLHLIAIHQKGRLVKIFRPRGKNITVGRSSRCTLALSDPRFPRKAAEIVLGPVTILRISGCRKDKGRFIPFPTGKPLRLGPYTLTLIEPGDVVLNRYFIRKSDKKTWLKRACLITSAGTIGFLFFVNHMGLLELTFIGKIPSTEKIGRQEKVENVPETDGRDEVVKGEDQRKVLSLPITEKKEDLPPKISTLIPPPSQKVKLRILKTSSFKVKPFEATKMKSSELEGIIKNAAKLIKQGDLKTPGRMLAPLLPHIDNEQRALIVELLDPAILDLYRKAYMLRLYEPESSREILVGITESELNILPSYWKALMILESDESTLLNSDLPPVKGTPPG